jgi:small subunit ribosomal protein S5
MADSNSNHMTDELQKDQVAEPTPSADAPAKPAAPAAAPAPAAEAPRGRGPMGGPRGQGGRGGFGNRGGRGGGRPGGRGGRPGDMQVESDYEEKNLEVARVTRVTKGGKRMRFRALTVIGNRKGRVGFGLAKGLDVAGATSKATAQARKSLLTIPLVNETIPHAVQAKFAAAVVLLKPAPKGTGIKAGGSVRNVLELAGVPNVTSKMLGSKNKINNVKATFKALRLLKINAKAPKAE